MKIEFYGLGFEAPRVSFHLWSPWRCTDLEHRLFGALKKIPLDVKKEADEWTAEVRSAAGWDKAVRALERVLKGWQEEANDAGGERRFWRWLLEADMDPSGYDESGEPTALWGLVRLGLDRSRPGEPEKSEDIDLEGFGVRIAPLDD